jgi:hypothetical protein
MTEENFKKQMKNIQRQHQIRQKFLTSLFQEISNTELLSELEKRVVERQTIKLSKLPNQDHISVEARDGKFILISHLPLEIKQKTMTKRKLQS